MTLFNGQGTILCELVVGGGCSSLPITFSTFPHGIISMNVENKFQRVNNKPRFMVRPVCWNIRFVKSFPFIVVSRVHVQVIIIAKACILIAVF